MCAITIETEMFHEIADNSAKNEPIFSQIGHVIGEELKWIFISSFVWFYFLGHALSCSKDSFVFKSIHKLLENASIQKNEHLHRISREKYF